MNHNHQQHCEHTLAYCGTCDVAYCTACNRQWGGYTYTWAYPNRSPNTMFVTSSTTSTAPASHAHAG